MSWPGTSSPELKPRVGWPGTATAAVDLARAVTPAPTPAPAFALQPAISPTSGTAGTTSFTATPGTVANGSITSRAWKLAGTTLATGLNFAPSSAQSGTLTYQETATGTDGSTVLSAVQSVVVAAASLPISQNASIFAGPGNAAATATGTSTGSAVTMRMAKVNLSGAPMSVVNLVHTAWVHTTGAPTNLGNDQPMVSQIEYPSGTVIATPPGYTVPNGGTFKTDDITLSTTIPNGATYVVQVVTTVANALKYMLNGGLVGVISTTAAGVARTKVVLAGAGDSLMANNAGAVLNSAAGRCPAIQFAITGTRASQYGASNAANFQKHLDLFQMLGCTDFFSDWASNDLQAGDTVATLQANVTNLRNGAQTRGMKVTWTTTPPRTNNVTKAVTSATPTGTNEVTLGVADASIYVVGDIYSVTETPNSFYTKGQCLCLGRDTTANTVRLLYSTNASRNVAATGTVTVTPALLSGGAGWQTPQFDNTRVPWNAVVRGGYFDSYVEWADNCEPSRDAGRWVNGRDKSPPLLAPFPVTISSVINSTRYGINPSMPNNSLSYLIWTSGANAGQAGQSAGSGSSDVTLFSAPTTAVAVGDTAHLLPTLAYATDDLTHPRDKLGGTSTTYGAQNLLEKPIIDWLTAKLA